MNNRLVDKSSELASLSGPFDSRGGPPNVPVEVAPVDEPASSKATATVNAVIVILSVVGFLYFARPVVLPIFLACVGSMTLKPLIRWLDQWHIAPALSTALVLSVLAGGITIGFIQLAHPALAWMNEAPQHISDLRRKAQKLFPRVARFSQAADAVNDLGTAGEGKRPPASVELKTSRVPTFINWTGTFLAGAGESLVLLYLLLASGDLFLQKLVRVMPTLRDKKRAVDISREMQQQISNYLFSVSVINIGVGIIIGIGLYWLGVPNAAMWGVLVAALNFVPYFGPIAGISLLAVVGLLTFDTLWRGLLPPAWYLLLHLLEANFITPFLLGRRFTLNPVVIFISLIFWTWLWGVPGALLSVPILVSIKVICERVPSMSPISELLTIESNSILDNIKLLRHPKPGTSADPALVRRTKFFWSGSKSLLNTLLQRGEGSAACPANRFNGFSARLAAVGREDKTVETVNAFARSSPPR